MIYNLSQSLGLFGAEITLAVSAILVIILDLFLKRESKHLTAYAALLGLAVAFLFTSRAFPEEMGFLFSRAVVIDPFARFFRLLFILAAFLTVLFTINYPDFKETNRGELHALILAVCLGMVLLAESADMVMMYLALELTSLLSYVLCALGVKGTKPREAAVKYMIFGAVASGLMIYGLSLVYGLAGTTRIYEIGRVLAERPISAMTLYVAAFFILSGFAFKISAVPFHMWSPDVYEGAPTPVTAFLSVGPKLAGFAVLVRFFYGAMSVQDFHVNAWVPVQGLNWPLVMAVISAVTMTLGNLAAIPQTNIKRMLAYSSIAHSGYILMGFVLLRNDGLYAMVFYTAIYLAMNLGAFLVVIAFSSKMNSEETSSYAGLGWKSPLMAICFAIFLFSLTGIPPLAGFTAKFLLFAAVVKQGFYWLVIIAALNSVISLYYYAGIVRQMFLVKPENQEKISVSPLHAALVVILAIPLVIFGIWWAPLEHFASFSSQFYLGY